MESILYALDKIERYEVSDHISYLYTTKEVDNQDLGYVNRTKDTITINLSLSDIDLEIKQSLSQLSSNSSSTGFVCWKKYPTTDVLELGSGIGGICASTLGPKCSRFVCSDQKDLLKLLKWNIENNCSLSATTSSKIKIIELDWEYPQNGIQNYQQTTGEGNIPDIIIGCDTIYNEYLIGHYLNTMKLLMNSSTLSIATVQLRDSITMESFIQKTVDSGFSIYIVNDDYLSPDLLKGFAVYCIVLDNA